MIVIEDALLKFLGTEKSRCMLLYGLTKSYSRHLFDGIIQMRNPLNSSEHVWANVVDLSPYKFHNSLVTQAVNEEMHRLVCTLKVCRESFGIRLIHCHPYVMIMGHHKSTIGVAIDFVERELKKY